jgi:predicted nucleic acid-binding protein
MKILATSVAASADVIVTGDQDLLVLKEFESIPILTSNEFCDHASADL